jgi:CrcB protein
LYGIVKAMQLLLVAASGAVGAVLRWRIGVTFSARTFPWSTLGINVVGSFVLAFILAGPATNRLSDTTTIALSVGLLGSFTTFSTFSYESITLIRDGRMPAALAYVALSLAGGLGAAALGYALGRSLAA